MGTEAEESEASRIIKRFDDKEQKGTDESPNSTEDEVILVGPKGGLIYLDIVYTFIERARIPLSMEMAYECVGHHSMVKNKAVMLNNLTEKGLLAQAGETSMQRLPITNGIRVLCGPGNRTRQQIWPLDDNWEALNKSQLLKKIKATIDDLLKAAAPKHEPPPNDPAPPPSGQDDAAEQKNEFVLDANTEPVVIGKILAELYAALLVYTREEGHGPRDLQWFAERVAVIAGTDDRQRIQERLFRLKEAGLVHLLENGDRVLVIRPYVVRYSAKNIGEPKIPLACRGTEANEGAMAEPPVPVNASSVRSRASTASSRSSRTFAAPSRATWQISRPSENLDKNQEELARLKDQVGSLETEIESRRSVISHLESSVAQAKSAQTPLLERQQKLNEQRAALEQISKLDDSSLSTLAALLRD